MSGLDRSLAQLYRRNLNVIKLGLDPVRALLEILGRPQDKFLSIHVAGTNGKGSVCAMLNAVLREAGFRVGLYISPHLHRFNERIRVGGVMIQDQELEELMAVVEGCAQEAAKLPGSRDVTFFEFATALAFEYFRRRNVQIAVLETGMGGRLDATNVVDPVVSIVTSIGMDHAEYLGDTLEKIAAEKAGIIKPGRAVVVGHLPPEAMRVIKKASDQIVVASDVAHVARKSQSLEEGQRIKIETQDGHYGPLTLPLAGAHQLGNCAVVVAAVEHLRDTYSLPISKEAVERGLENVKWPARFQLVSRNPPIIVDGAHNPEAAAALAKTLGETGEGKPVALIVGFLSEKDGAGIMRELAPRVRKCWAVQIHNSRAMPIDQVVARIRDVGMEPAAASLKQAIHEATEWAKESGGMVCVTGSLYLAGEALALMEKL